MSVVPARWSSKLFLARFASVICAQSNLARIDLHDPVLDHLVSHGQNER